MQQFASSPTKRTHTRRSLGLPIAARPCHANPVCGARARILYQYRLFTTLSSLWLCKKRKKKKIASQNSSFSFSNCCMVVQCSLSVSRRGVCRLRRVRHIRHTELVTHCARLKTRPHRLALKMSNLHSHTRICVPLLSLHFIGETFASYYIDRTIDDSIRNAVNWNEWRPQKIARTAIKRTVDVDWVEREQRGVSRREMHRCMPQTQSAETNQGGTEMINR